MNSAAQRTSLPSVVVAGVVAIILAVFGVLFCAFTGLSLLLLPEVQRASTAPAMLPQIRIMAALSMVLTLAVCVFGIFVGIGVIRRRNWARISILTWGCFMTVCCLLVIVFGFLTFGSISSMQLPNVNSAESSGILHFMTIFLAVFYGIPAVIGIWWLVLFTRPRVAAAFTNPVLHAPEMDASGFPQISDGQPASMSRGPSCPVAIAGVAGFMIFGGVCSLLFLFLPFPSGIPMFFLGHAFAGVSVRIFLVTFGLLGGIAGVGVLKLKLWALHTAIGLQLFNLLNCTLTYLSPKYIPTMRAAMEKMSPQSPTFAQGSPVMSGSFFYATMIFTTLLVVVLLVILLWQRSRFLEAASAAKA